MTGTLKGWRTLIFNAIVIILPPLLTYLAAVNWSDYVDPQVAVYVVAVVNLALRIITTTPIGKKQ